jgi:hypothetical protein
MQSNNTQQNDDDLTSGGGEDAIPREATPVYRRANVDQRYTQSVISPGFTRPTLKLHPSAPSGKGSSKWSVIKAEPIPFFPLERPVEINEPSWTVSEKVGDSLYHRSVQAEFKDSQAICTTSSFVIYSIDLYAGPNGSTILEIIRRSGCGYAYRKEREAVLNAARGYGGDVPTKLLSVMKIPPDLLAKYEPPTQEEHEDTLNRACDQLHSDQRDVQLFTLQNLSSMTAPEVVNTGSAQLLGKLLMENCSGILDLIVALLNSFVQEDISSSGKILNSCLTILSNSMTSLSEGKMLETTLKQKCQGFTDKIIPALVIIVKDCKCLHNACLALKCLGLLLKNSSEACSRMSEEIRSIVTDAQLCGQQRHKKLKEEAESTLDVLKCQ